MPRQERQSQFTAQEIEHRLAQAHTHDNSAVLDAITENVDTAAIIKAIQDEFANLKKSLATLDSGVGELLALCKDNSCEDSLRDIALGMGLRPHHNAKRATIQKMIDECLI